MDKNKGEKEIDFIVHFVEKMKDDWEVTIYMDNGDIYPGEDDLSFLYWEHSVGTYIERIEFKRKKQGENKVNVSNQ